MGVQAVDGFDKVLLQEISEEEIRGYVLGETRLREVTCTWTDLLFPLRDFVQCGLFLVRGSEQ